MAAAVRNDINVFAKDVVILVEKVDGSSTYVLFGCITSLDYESSGMGVLEIACRSGLERIQDGVIAPPTLSLENAVRKYLSADDAMNITDDDLQLWNDTGATKNVKYVVGNHAGDSVYTGPGFFSGFTRKAGDKGLATSSSKFNFRTVPTKTQLA